MNEVISGIYQLKLQPEPGVIQAYVNAYLINGDNGWYTTLS